MDSDYTDSNRGFTDLFNKMSVDYNDKDFYIKLTIWTGLATGVLLILILPFSESKMPVVELAAKYMLFIPTTLLYIIHYIGICGAQISGAFGFFAYTERFRRNGHADDFGILSLFWHNF